MFIRSMTIDWTPSLLGTYVADIPALRRTSFLPFRKPVTFLAGENGSGKSTLLEALAIASGLNPEGGTRNYHFSTCDDYSELRDSVRLARGAGRPPWSYFLRAESFYTMATASVEEYQGRDYHTRSHGESFLDFIQDNSGTGLYLMDEPEAALSPQRQLTLLLTLHQMAEKGSQFIIATHSPILLGTPDAEILLFDDSGIRPAAWEETESYRVTKMFLNGRERFLRELLRED